MRMTTGQACDPDVVAAVARAARGLPERPNLVIASVVSTHDPEATRAALSERFPGVSLHVATTCQGAMTSDAVVMAEGAIALASISDPNGAAGSALVEGPERSDVEAAVLEAARRAQRQGERPDLAWISGAPGTEEALLAALAEVLGESVPLYGGSSADQVIAGQWWVADASAAQRSGAVVTLIFTGSRVLHAYHSGYAPTSRSGVVTRSSGRLVEAIDGETAADVYIRWTSGALAPWRDGGNILAASTLFPLAVQVGAIGVAPYHRLLHPETIRPDGAMTLFAEAPEGTRLICMSGDPDSLVTRVGRVAHAAMATDGAGLSGIRGALVTYCAGCMLAVQPRLAEVHENIRAALPGIPFICQFTFGEQGTFPGGESCHGNLMISVVLFRDYP